MGTNVPLRAQLRSAEKNSDTAHQLVARIIWELLERSNETVILEWDAVPEMVADLVADRNRLRARCDWLRRAYHKLHWQRISLRWLVRDLNCARVAKKKKLAEATEERDYLLAVMVDIRKMFDAADANDHDRFLAAADRVRAAITQPEETTQ